MASGGVQLRDLFFAAGMSRHAVDQACHMVAYMSNHCPSERMPWGPVQFMYPRDDGSVGDELFRRFEAIPLDDRRKALQALRPSNAALLSLQVCVEIEFCEMRQRFGLRSQPGRELRSAFRRMRTAWDLESPETFESLRQALLHVARAPLPAGLSEQGLTPSVEMEKRCRSDRAALAVVNQAAPLLEKAALEEYRRMRPFLYLPRSGNAPADAATMWQFTDADEQDLREFLLFLAALIATRRSTAHGKAAKCGIRLADLVCQAYNSVEYSVYEALALSYFRVRFPQFYWLAERACATERPRLPRELLPQDGSPAWDETEFVAAIEKKRAFVRSVLRVLGSLGNEFPPLQTGNVHLDTFGEAIVVTNRMHLQTFGQNLNVVNCLSGRNDFLGVLAPPEGNRPRPWTPRGPVPNARITVIEELPHCHPQYSVTLMDTFYHHPGITHAIDAFSLLVQRWHATGEVNRLPGRICLHRPNGRPCLSTSSLIPLEELFHPEDPLLVVAGRLTRRWAELSRYFWSLFLFLRQAPPQLRERLETVHLVVHLPQSAEHEFGTYWLLSIEEARAIDLVEWTESLPASERALLLDLDLPVPDHGVAVRLPEDDDDDDSGDEFPEGPFPTRGRKLAML